VSTTTDIHGPIDFVLLQFPTDQLTGEASQALVDLVERGIVRIYDLLVIRKSESGAVEVLEIENPAHGASSFSYFSGAHSGILGDEDAEEAAAAMDPGTVAVLIVYENTWAIPFVAAARESGGELAASARIPATDVIAALEKLEAAPA
jgi:dihydroorotase-like cyclic amidohydrolase